MSNDIVPVFSIKVYGCQMNAYDGDRLRSAMLARGWREAAAPGEADFVFFVTCSIREKAEQKVVSELGRFRPLWEKRAKPAIALLGCMAQRMGEDVAKRFPWVRVVAGPRHLGAVPDAVEVARAGGPPRLLLDQDPRELDDLDCVPIGKENPHKAYVTIAHGCDQFCSYCIVPHVRGRFGSREPDAVLAEVEDLVARGVLEVTLLGQNVNTYGRDFSGTNREGYRFARLLQDAAAVKGLKRLRFTTSHPVDFTDDILAVMQGSPVICPGINLPVQAGDDKVLREMNRKYTRAQYMETMRQIREALPILGLTTDLIVGFPGETEEEYEESVSLVEAVRFDLVHTAAYSPREGTPAARRTDQVPGNVRARRLVRLNELQSAIAAEINEALIGTTWEILIDEPAPRGKGLMQGRTITDKVVLVAGASVLAGTFRNVRIVASSPWCLEGEIV